MVVVVVVMFLHVHRLIYFDRHHYAPAAIDPQTQRKHLTDCSRLARSLYSYQRRSVCVAVPLEFDCHAPAVAVGTVSAAADACFVLRSLLLFETSHRRSKLVSASHGRFCIGEGRRLFVGSLGCNVGRTVRKETREKKDPPKSF